LLTSRGGATFRQRLGTDFHHDADGTHSVNLTHNVGTTAILRPTVDIAHRTRNNNVTRVPHEACAVWPGGLRPK
jgi:hypothetical protein